ncbi:MAG: hypothetical protein RL026_1780 [Pseudomonadota bacterium]|jgi:type II secretory pathway predicted ATPase ExeA
MYIEHFKLREAPFRLSPDPQFLYLSKHHARAKAYMESTIWFTDGFVVITGEIGAGKTTLIETFLSEIDRDVVVAQVNQTQVSANEFLQALLVQFGYQPFKMKKAELIATINEFLIEQHAAGRKVLLIVDEAQNLPLKVLEELRMLSGVETTKEKVLRIILAGQPELNDKLDSPELVQLAQRIRLRFHLTSLSLEDLQGYVQHRLDVAGANGRVLFADNCHPLLFRYTGGIPRLINTLCETALLAAAVEEHEQVTLQDLQAAIEELGWPEYHLRTKGLGQAQRAARPRPEAAAATRAAAFVAAEPVGAPAVVRLHAEDDELASTASDVSGRDARPAPGPQLVVSSDDDEYLVLARVVVAKEGRVAGELALRVGRLVVGRTPDNDLQIESRFISRHHCQILTSAEGCVVEDLGSTNGIVIAGRRVQRQLLQDGDVIVVGRHELRYHDERNAELPLPGQPAMVVEEAVAPEVGPAVVEAGPAVAEAAPAAADAAPIPFVQTPFMAESGQAWKADATFTETMAPVVTAETPAVVAPRSVAEAVAASLGTQGRGLQDYAA